MTDTNDFIYIFTEICWLLGALHIPVPGGEPRTSGAGATLADDSDDASSHSQICRALESSRTASSARETELLEKVSIIN